MTPTQFEAYAVYAEQTKSVDDTVEMATGVVARTFNTQEVQTGIAIRQVSEREIELQPGTYRISGVSILTMVTSSAPVPTDGLTNIYPGYCMVYDSSKPPTEQDMSGVICLGTPGTAYDTDPSIFDCFYSCEQTMRISLGHQCSYDMPADHKVYLRAGGSIYHVFARMAILKIA